MDQLRFPKIGGVMRIVVTLVIVCTSVFCVVMGIFMTQSSELTCTNGTDYCLRQTLYPFGISFQEPVPAFQRVSLRTVHDKHGTSLDLILHHADGTATDYSGVGKNGDRAARTMQAIEAYMASPQGTRSFPLRSGSTPLGAMAIALGLLLLLAVFPFFNNVYFTRRGDELVVRVERRPLAAREVVVPVASVETVQVISKTSAGQTVFAVTLCVRDREPIDLGLGGRSWGYARMRAQALGEQLAPVLDA